jgi:hypothetical protein
MAGMQGLGRVFNVVPIASTRGLSMKQCSGIEFICTGADTFTLTVAAGFAGSYATPGSIITTTYTNTATNGTAAWVKNVQAAANTVVIGSGAVSFFISEESLPDTKNYVKVTASASGLVTAIMHGLTPKRTPANLAIPSA